MNRIRSIVAVSLLTLIGLSGCIGSSSRAQIKPADRQLPQTALPLTVQETQLLREWYHAAQLADSVEDYTIAMNFYSRIVEYFPDTAEGAHAAGRLTHLRGASAAR